MAGDGGGFNVSAGYTFAPLHIPFDVDELEAPAKHKIKIKKINSAAGEDPPEILVVERPTLTCYVIPIVTVTRCASVEHGHPHRILYFSRFGHFHTLKRFRCQWVSRGISNFVGYSISFPSATVYRERYERNGTSEDNDNAQNVSCVI